MNWIQTSERLPELPDHTDASWPWNESDVVLIKTIHGSRYTAQLRSDKPDDWDSRPMRWILCGGDGYDLALDQVVSWLPIPD